MLFFLYKKKKKELIDLIKSIFPEDTYVENGYWSWAEGTVNLLYPEALFKSVEKDSVKVLSGIAFLIEEETSVHMLDMLDHFQVPYCVISLKDKYNKALLVSKISRLFKNKVVPENT